MIATLVEDHIDDWCELTTPSVGERVYVYGSGDDDGGDSPTEKSSCIQHCSQRFRYLHHLTLTITNFLTWSLAIGKRSGGASVDSLIG